jgi:hypothetical protein
MALKTAVTMLLLFTLSGCIIGGGCGYKPTPGTYIITSIYTYEDDDDYSVGADFFADDQAKEPFRSMFIGYVDDDCIEQLKLKAGDSFRGNLLERSGGGCAPFMVGFPVLPCESERIKHLYGRGLGQ